MLRKNSVDGAGALVFEGSYLRTIWTKWPTIDKINSALSQIFAHTQRHGLISSQMGCNPFRPPKFGGVRCKTESDYEAKVVTPEQMIAILEQLDRPETRLEWTLALVHAATALRPEECFALK